MYQPPLSTTPNIVHNSVLQEKKPSAWLISLFDAMPLLSNAVAAICTTNVYTVQPIKEVNVVPVGECPKLSSPWRGPYRISKCLNDVNYQIKKLTTGKVQIVHFDRTKGYHGPIPVAANVQTRLTTHITGYQPHPVPNFNHSQCGQTFLLFTFAPQMTSLDPVNRLNSPIPSPTPIADNFLIRSVSTTPPPLLSSARQCALLFPTRSFDHERHLLTPPLI